MARTTSPRFGISYPDPATRNEPADVPADIKRLVDAFEILTPMYVQGTIAARPAAGKLGRFYFATNEGILYLDSGTTWVAWGPPAGSVGPAQIGDNAVSLAGPFASRPAANTVVAGYEYFATDTVASYRSSGTAWVRMDADMGKVDHFALAPAAGWMRADNTPITAAMTHATDLRAALIAGGNRFGISGSDPRVPNAQGRVSVDQDATADFDTIGKALGAKTVAAPLLLHSHTVNSHNHTPGTGGRNRSHAHAVQTRVAIAGYGLHSSGTGYTNGQVLVKPDSGTGSIVGLSVYGDDPDHEHGVYAEAPGTNNQGQADTSHNNLQPYIVLPAYIKL